jgi:mono/diheme cytochrome c family protein
MSTQRAVLVLMLVGGALMRVGAHGLASTPTWNREISRIVYDKCASCHRPGGGAFSLLGYLDAQPRANEIKDAVLSRRMPPWGAVKGFGSFRNDQSLTEEQIELVRRWVDGGIRRGNNPQMLPAVPAFSATAPFRPPDSATRVSGPSTIRDRVVVDALFPEKTPTDSLRIVAQLPDGRVEPLVWLHGYDARYAHPFVLRRPIELPPGTRVQGVPTDAVLALIPRTH